MRRFLSSRLGGEQGIALPLVIGVTAVLLLLASVAVTYSVGGLKQSKTTEDWSAALAAAYAGIEEYQSRIADDTTYMQYGNPASPFSTGSTLDAAEPRESGLRPRGDRHLGGDPERPGHDDELTGGNSYYRYEVNTSQYSATGAIRIRSTGRSGEETRSVVADLRQKGFIDFLWFTKYEIQDPVYTGALDDLQEQVRLAGSIAARARLAELLRPLLRLRRRPARAGALQRHDPRLQHDVRGHRHDGEPRHPEGRREGLQQQQLLGARTSSSSAIRPSAPRSGCRRPTGSSSARRAAT